MLAAVSAATASSLFARTLFSATTLTRNLANNPALRAGMFVPWARKRRVTSPDCASERLTPSFLAASATRSATTFFSVNAPTFIGVEVTLPSTSTVAVHSNLQGRSSGLVYRIVTAPVAASRERLKFTGQCSSVLMPYFASGLFRSALVPACERRKATEPICFWWTSPQSSLIFRPMFGMSA